MYGTVRGTVYGYSLWEFEVYGSLANHPPTLVAVPDQTILAGRTLWVTNSATDPEAPPQVLTYSLLQAPAGASIDANSGIFSWRPAIYQSPSTQSVRLAVSDNGTPPLSATQSFNLTVGLPATPILDAATFTNGQFSFAIHGDTGPDYVIQASSNMISWVTLSTNVSPSLPFFWADTNSAPYPANFYRVLLGP
jgi:hypothetical protein